jgi:hypothetical protein
MAHRANGRTITSLKSQLLPAFKSFAQIIPTIPKSTSDFQLYEEKQAIEGAESTGATLRCIEEDEKGFGNKSLAVLGWPRWKKVFVR